VIDLDFITDPGFRPDRRGILPNHRQSGDQAGGRSPRPAMSMATGAPICSSAPDGRWRRRTSGEAYVLILASDLADWMPRTAPPTGSSIWSMRPPPVCFVAGTLIATPAGAVPVERLRPGDLVETWDQGAQPVRWVTHTIRSLADLVTNPKWRPVRIPAGALGHKQPARTFTSRASTGC
jgi:hypothetical protein